MSKFDKVVSLKPYRGKVFLKNKVFRLGDSPNIFLDFDKRLKKRGITINTVDVKSKDPIDKHVYCDVPYPWELGLWLKIIFNKEKSALFCFESPLINPFSHLKIIRHFFEEIYTWDNNKVDNKKYFKFKIPQLSRGADTKSKAFKKKKFLVLINSKKDAPLPFQILSPYKQNLYKKRLDLINYFEKEHPQKLDLYGKGWNKNFRVYKREVKYQKKIDLLSNYRFCLCFENTMADGYITEKIFDCFKARCVPIYLGAPNIGKYIPKDTFIDFRKFDNYSELLVYLESINRNKYRVYIKAIERFLANKKNQARWFEDGFEKIFLGVVR